MTITFTDEDIRRMSRQEYEALRCWLLTYGHRYASKILPADVPKPA